MHRKQYSAFLGEGEFWRAHGSGSERQERAARGLRCERGMKRPLKLARTRRCLIYTDLVVEKENDDGHACLSFSRTETESDPLP